MNWFNYYGLIAIAVILIPNILCMIFDRTAFENCAGNKPLIIVEQIGRYGCMLFMVFNIPYTWFGFWFPHALIAYLSVNGGLCLVYLFFWIICWNHRGKLRALTLSIVPSGIFLYSGIVLVNIPLIIFAIIFCVSHPTLSYKNETELIKSDGL